MRRIFAIVIVLVILPLTSKAQNVYTPDKLEQASQKELSLYLDKAQGLKKTGSILTIAGSISALSGLVLAGAGESTFPLGFGMLLAGSGVTLVGIPVWITGASRVKKVSTTINARQVSASIELAPAFCCNNGMQKLQPLLKLSMSF
jgi:hypothetical protein